MCVGLRLTERPDTDSVWGSFNDGVREYGAPATARMDNGKAYRNRSFSGGRLRVLDEHYRRALLGRLGVQASFSDPYNAEGKAVCERFFKTLHEQFDRRQPTYRGGKPEKRPEQLATDLRKRRIAIPKIADVRRQLASWVEMHNNRPHSGLDGRSPLYVFQHCDPLPRRTAPEAVLDRLLQRVVEVKVSKNGVRWQGCHYGRWNPVLQKWHGKSVLLLVNPEPNARADRIEVLDQDFKHITWAVDDRNPGLTNEQIKEARKAQQRTRKDARRAKPALRDARKSTVEFAIAAQREQANRMRKAVGAEHDVPPPPRDVALVPGAARFAADVFPPPTRSSDSTDHSLQLDDLELHTGRRDTAADLGDVDDTELCLEGSGATACDYGDSLDDVSLRESAGTRVGETASGSSQGRDEPVGDIVAGLDGG